jgi:hypothetical protein
MLIIYNKDDNPKVIRPCPLISISFTKNRNKVGNLGGSYDITLTGAILPDEGSPLSTGGASASLDTIYQIDQKFASVYDPRPESQIVPVHNRMASIINKQHMLRELFAIDGQRFELLPPVIEGKGGDEPVLVFYPTLQSINFEEGVYINICRYTINLRAEVLLDRDNKIIADGLPMNFEPSGNYAIPTDKHFCESGRLTIEEYNDRYGGFVEDFSENWAIEAEDGNGITIDPRIRGAENVIRTYRLTRNVSATGKTLYGPKSSITHGHRFEAWTQARDFIRKKVMQSGVYTDYPQLDMSKYLGSGFINLASNAYGGYNHSRTENIDKTAGTYSISDTWLLSSGTSYETYNMSFSSSVDTTENTVGIQGTIKGLSSIPPSGSIFGGNMDSNLKNSPYENATLKYIEITNNGNFGITSHIYKRITNVTSLQFNPIPQSITVGVNEFTGEITYDMTFNTRPCSVIPGTISETINVNDTYPGDIFAIIPVLGRSTGPVLQYLGSRTEYRRDASIELVFSSNNVPCTTTSTTTPAPGQPEPTTTTEAPSVVIPRDRNQFLFSKPTLYEPTRTQINNLIKSLSPAYEYGIRKYFLNPPTESWNARERRYSLNLSWVYELDH